MIAPAAVLSVSPIVLAAPERGTELRVRTSAPAEMRGALPLVVFAHGFASNGDAYAPLAAHWAAQGLVVVQPTFLDSLTIGLSQEDPRVPLIWRQRVADVKLVLDQLDVVERALPGLAGHLDRDRIAVAGHSFGAHTAGLLLGARVLRPDGSLDEDMSDPRIKAGVLLCAGGRGGEDLTPFAAEHLPYLNQSYASLTTPTLVVAGDDDHSPLTVRGPDWFDDAYTLSPGAGWLATLFGGGHMLGGISGDRVTETTDENPARVAAVQRLTGAYLRSALHPGDTAWPEACAALAASPQPLGKVEGKGVSAARRSASA